MAFYGYHGLYPEENVLGQKFLVDVELFLDLRSAGISDEMSKSIHYGEVYETIKVIMEGKPIKLIESIAEKIANEVLKAYPLLHQITVRVYKTNPPIPGFYESVSVEVTRSR
jgi:dihydroneopterin aldolase